MERKGRTMTISEYLEEAGWARTGDYWIDPCKGKLWSERDALDAQRDYDRPGWEQEAERLKAEWDKQEEEE